MEEEHGTGTGWLECAGHLIRLYSSSFPYLTVHNLTSTFTPAPQHWTLLSIRFPTVQSSTIVDQCKHSKTCNAQVHQQHPYTMSSFLPYVKEHLEENALVYEKYTRPMKFRVKVGETDEGLKLAYSFSSQFLIKFWLSCVSHFANSSQFDVVLLMSLRVAGATHPRLHNSGLTLPKGNYSARPLIYPGNVQYKQ